MATGHEGLGGVEPNYTTEALLFETIGERGKITFADFMNVSLYGPEGYYASGRAAIGRGDFQTAPETHPAYGYSVATALVELMPSGDEPIKIKEMGAGNGTLAHQILTKFVRDYPGIYSRCRYQISEVSQGLIDKQQQLLQGEPVGWVHESAADIVDRNVDVALSNELLDAMPVNLLRNTEAGFREVYISIDEDGNFVEVEGDLSGEVQSYGDYLSIVNVPLGAVVTVSPMRSRWLASMARALRPGGYLLTSDYATKLLQEDVHAYEPRVYASYLNPPTGHPIARAYEFPGTVDITASVDMRQLAFEGAQHGLETVYHGTQRDFLQIHNFEAERDRIMEEERRSSGTTDNAAHYYASYLLLSPEQMGDHEILIQRRIQDPPTNIEVRKMV